MTTLELSGLSCDHCVRAVTNALKEVEGVTSADVTLERAVVQGTATADALVAAIVEEGYEARVGVGG